jgi:membrane associated rhomboid family serine protease
MLRTKQWQQNFSFGGRIPWAVGLLIALTAGSSLTAAFLGRHTADLVQWVSLIPSQVWHGQVWRLVTWPFIEQNPFFLIFACLSLFWFGPPLAQRSGSPRFLALIGYTILAAAAGTCLVALVDPEVMAHRYVSSWAIITGLVVIWGLTFSDQTVRIWMIIPIRGYWMAWGSVALTVVLAIYYGWAGFLPELFAEAAVLAWFYRSRLFARWSRARHSWETQRRQAERSKESRRRGGVVVDLRTGEPPDPNERDIN